MLWLCSLCLPHSVNALYVQWAPKGTCLCLPHSMEAVCVQCAPCGPFCPQQPVPLHMHTSLHRHPGRSAG